MIAPLSNAHGSPVDWWFMYKLPVDIGPKNQTTGFQYLCLDSQPGSFLSCMPVQAHEKQAILAHCGT